MTPDQLTKIETDVDSQLARAGWLLEKAVSYRLTEGAYHIKDLCVKCKLLLAAVRVEQSLAHAARSEAKNAEDIQARCMALLERVRMLPDTFLPKELEQEISDLINGKL